MTTQAKLDHRPLVSVVTPFYNTARYLAQCMESVLTQTYTNFEYILVDNCSTDGSSEIAQSYARSDPRIRLIRSSDFVSQLRNYNRALEQISQASDYCKMVEADNYIYPHCLQLMIRSFEQSAKIGLVSSYTLLGNEVSGSGYPHQMSMVSGREWARRHLRGAPFVFGSPTTVMYRSSVVRHHQPFYNESLLHADTEKCMEMLEDWDLGFVHQVLSFLRTDNVGISSVNGSAESTALDRYIITQRYASVFLEANEAQSTRAKSKQAYYRVLAGAVIRLRGRAFWRYHKAGLQTLQEALNWPYLTLQTVLVLLWMASNPGWTTLRVFRFWKRRSICRGGIKTQEKPERNPEIPEKSLYDESARLQSAGRETIVRTTASKQ